MTHNNAIPRWVSIFFSKRAKTMSLAAILFCGLSSGCQTAPAPNATPLSSPTPNPPTITVTASITATFTPAPTFTSTPKPFPTPVFATFPAPRPLKSFPPPKIENLLTTRLSGGLWTTYQPADFQNQYASLHESPYVSAVTIAPDGSFWFSTTGGPASGGVGVYRFDGNNWTHYRKENGLGFDEISSAIVAPDGALWFGSFCCGAVRFDGNTWTAYGTDNGLASSDIRSLAVGPDGSLWFGTDDAGVTRFDGAAWGAYTADYSADNSLWGNYVGAIFTLPDNSMLFSTSDGSAAKLDRFDGRRWSEYPTQFSDPRAYTESLAVDRSGSLWFGTELFGVYRQSGSTWTHFSTVDMGGLPSNQVSSLVTTPDGAVWVTTAEGLSCYDDATWTNYTLVGVGGYHWTGALAAAPDGSLWIAYSGGIAHFVPPTAQ